MSENLGLSGKLAKRFLTTEITPLLALVGILLGLFAIAVTPREEEPQINVTFANIFIPFAGATAVEIEHLVATPAEQVLSEIKGVKHVYSISRPGMAIITVQYRVGEDRTQAIVHLYNKVLSNQDWLPQNLGVGMPIIKPMGIDDVPIVTATLWSKDETVGAYELGQVAHTLESELKRIPGTRNIYTIGEPERAVKVTLNPQSLSAYGISLSDLRASLHAANATADSMRVTSANQELLIQAGAFLTSASELGGLVVGMHQGKPVHLQDVADIQEGPDNPQQYVWIGAGPEAASQGLELEGTQPAVTIAVAKKPGSNAVEIAERVIERFESMQNIFIPDGIEVTITRNYGETADQKARKLISKLIFATLSVIGLIVITLGWREAIIIGAAVAITLLITLFASWAWGFTLNRVSLFALIFSIGILVDDAIVVVENIHRHMAMGADNLREAIPKAVDEVGGPTILATFTVIAALLPMAFVSGLMGPYMSPIPINASLGMLISLAIALTVTPWFFYKIMGHRQLAHAVTSVSTEHRLTALFTRIMSPFLDQARGRANRWKLLAGILLLIAASIALGAFKLVVLKMLPFDNKSEFQIILDMPEGTALEQTTRVLSEIGDYIATVPEVTNYQVYAGTSSPIGFNGLVRQYYLREGSHLGDIQINLVDKSSRDRNSHTIARSVREPVQAIARRYQGNAKIVEVPPGPPVMSPLVAEIYGIDYAGQIRTAKDVRHHFEASADIVDVDDMIETPSEKRIVLIDRAKAARLGITQSSVTAALSSVLDGEDVTFMHGQNLKYPVPIRIEYSEADKANLDEVMSLKIRSRSGALVSISEFTSVVSAARANTIYHKDLLPVTYVTGDMAGDIDSPLYGLFDISASIAEHDKLEQWFLSQPDNPYQFSIKWDGEWQITYETFRDMGIAYAVGLILIYLLVVAQFRSYLVPLVIMAPIPLTIIGIMPGHLIAQAQFTATSMIGMIALAGIIVRNSILLVDFINQQVREGKEFSKAVIHAAAVRTQPIVLTAVAAMAGGFFILDDPIFSGLAVSLIFGLLASTILTLVVIPVVYFAAMQNRLEQLRN